MRSCGRRTTAGLGLALVLGASGFLAGCAATGPGPSTIGATGAGPVWPPAPDPARIAYLGSVQRPSDLGCRISAMRRFVNWLTGSEQGNEPLVKPFGLALDENDNLCVTDTGSGAVYYYDLARGRSFRWDRIGKLAFDMPVAVAKRRGTIYVADTGLKCVVAFNEDGKLQGLITNSLERPAGLALYGDRLFVADSLRHCVAIFDVSGRYIDDFGSRGVGNGQFNYPTHLTMDSQGTCIVTDTMNARLQRLDRTGRYLDTIGCAGDSPGCFGRPKGVAVDGIGRLYVVDAAFDHFQIFDAQGRILLPVGCSGDAPGQFCLPSGIAVGRDGTIFVADTYNHRVQVFKPVGQP